ncbi:MAG TPA: Uma2 family endonuclease [Kofleriaceae bacterium]|nr:Uma2 family endonuclease [Kofleriaceae bacterium]
MGRSPSHGPTRFLRPRQLSKRGLEGAELVVEILSPDDESRDKLPFYANVGVREAWLEAWLIEPSTLAIEVLSLRDSEWIAVVGSNDRVRSPYLDIEIESAGSALRLHDADDLIEV